MKRLLILSALCVPSFVHADLTDSGQLVIAGTATIQGNAFSVGQTTVVVQGSKVGLGTSSPASKLHVSSGAVKIDGAGGSLSVGDAKTAGTLSLYDTLTFATGSVVLASWTPALGVTFSTQVTVASSFSVTGAMAIGGAVTAASFTGSGAGLTSLSGSSLQAGTVDTAKLATDSVTTSRVLNGAITPAKMASSGWNAAGTLVQLDSNSKLPAIDGSQLTNLPSASGTALVASSQTFTGSNNFTQTTASMTVLALNNFCVEVASADVVEVTSMTFTDPAVDMTSYTYILRGSGKLTTTGIVEWGVLFNHVKTYSYCDTGTIFWNGSNYGWWCTSASANSYLARIVSLNTNSMGNGSLFMFEAKISTLWGRGGLNLINDASLYDTGSPAGVRQVNGATYVASGVTLTSIDLVGSSSAYNSAAPTANKSYSGHFELWRCGWKVN